MKATADQRSLESLPSEQVTEMKRQGVHVATNSRKYFYRLSQPIDSLLQDAHGEGEGKRNVHVEP